MGSVTLGVQGEEATKAHPSGMPIGQLAATHELGLGVPRRSWLGSWLEANEARMLEETRAAFAEVMARRTTRNKALQALGYRWTEQLRKHVAEGNVQPPLAASTVARKGHNIPLLDTATMVNAITYKVFLPLLKSIRDVAQRTAARGGK
jgi:hypothetical protein